MKQQSMPESLKKKTVKGVAWTSLNQVLNMGFGFVIGVILARILSPDDYGLLAMIAVFNAIATAFIDSGFASALVRKPDLTEDDNTTAFCFNLIVGAVMFGIIWLIAPWVSSFYDKPILISLLRAEGSLLIITSFIIVQGIQLTRALNFKALMITNIVSQFFAGVIAIIAAYNGFGVWSLVIQHISSRMLSLVLLWIISPWRPRGKWNKNSFSYLWGYGSKLLASGLLDKIYGNIYPIIIGKFYSAADLWTIFKGQRICQFTVSKLDRCDPAGHLSCFEPDTRRHKTIGQQLSPYVEVHGLHRFSCHDWHGRLGSPTCHNAGDRQMVAMCAIPSNYLFLVNVVSGTCYQLKSSASKGAQ